MGRGLRAIEDVMYYMEELYLFIEVLENAIVMAGTLPQAPGSARTRVSP